MLLKKKRIGCIFNRKYYLCNIDMHSSLSCERESPNTPQFAFSKLQIHILALFFSHKSSTKIILFANLNHFETYLFSKRM